MEFTWQDAENLAAAHMRLLGFADASTTRKGADRGLDVAATGAAAQVKYQQATVGSPVVQRLAGAARTVQTLLFYSTSAYTRSALEVADEMQMALFTYNEVGIVHGVNGPAKQLEAAATDLPSNHQVRGFDPGSRIAMMRHVAEVTICLRGFYWHLNTWYECQPANTAERSARIRVHTNWERNVWWEIRHLLRSAADAVQKGDLDVDRWLKPALAKQQWWLEASPGVPGAYIETLDRTGAVNNVCREFPHMREWILLKP